MTEAARNAYARAVAAVCSGEDPTDALRRAAAADPELAIAVVDLRAWQGAAGAPQPSPVPSQWERRHMEIVSLAATDPHRAEALLREHTARSGCDPLALAIVARHLDGIDGERLADLRARACTCCRSGYGPEGGS